MTVQEYYDKLGDFLKENPECKDMLAIYAKDDEGNAHQGLSFDPGTKGRFANNEFIDEGSVPKLKEMGFPLDDFKVNAVCIN